MKAASAIQKHPSLMLSLAAATALVISILLRPGQLPQLSVCAFHSTTGLPCPGCGLTRAFCAIGHGDFAAAWAFHPFSFLLYGLALGVALYPFLRRVTPHIFDRVLTPARVMGFTVGLVAAMFVFGVFRIVSHWN